MSPSLWRVWHPSNPPRIVTASQRSTFLARKGGEADGYHVFKTFRNSNSRYTFQAESRIDKDPHGLGQKVYTRLAQRLIENGTTMAALYGTITVEAKWVKYSQQEDHLALTTALPCVARALFRFAVAC